MLALGTTDMGKPTTRKLVTAQSSAFARRLHHRIHDLGISQSDLARKIWGSATDARGYNVAKNRDRISDYLKGVVPDRQNLILLAKALDMPPEELFPEAMTSKMDRKNPPFELSMIPDDPSRALLLVNMVVPVALGADVIKLLSKVKP